jgi:hypothetical protein
MREAKKIYVAPGDTVFVRLGSTELCMSMRLVGTVMPLRVLDHREGCGQLLDPQGQPYSTPIPLDAEVHEAFSAWGGDHSRSEHATVAREAKNLPTAHEATRTALALAKRYGYGRAFRDTYLSLPTRPRLPAGRSVLPEV